jgi:nicotinate-nucleotide--dimethylbenzimidazole phosphoribosyltransferase
MALTLLLGGARSGKSALAVRRARASERPVVFVATGEARDAEMAERIARHRAERDPGWSTVEAPLELAAALDSAPAGACVVVDCLSLWVANLIERGEGENAVVALAADAARLAATRGGPTIAVSNEVGMGLVPEYELGRIYRDLLGRANAIWADHAAEAMLVVAGRPLALGVAMAPERARVATPDRDAEEAARTALDRKTKPRGSLGRLEDLACRIAGIRGAVPTAPLAPVVVVCAADHGVATEGVSAYPQEVTAQMLGNFANGGAAVCVLARQAGARLVVADVGVREPVDHPAILDRRVRAGTANAAQGPAMTRADAERSIAVGVELAADLIADGAGIVALGEMGIANTTAASALTAALLRVDPDGVCGRGTGLDDAGVERKRAVVWRMLESNCVSPYDPLGALAGVGGLEIGALAGVVLGCAQRRTPVLVDGFISAAAALLAVCLENRCAGTLIAAHRSPEPGHRLILHALGLQPLLELDMRLGEGSGAALALPIVTAAVAILTDMASFDAAGVTDAGA